MGLSTVVEALDRISIAPEHSKILVVETPDRRALRTMYAATIESQKMIQKGDSSIIGIYSKQDIAAEADYLHTKRVLSKYVNTKTASPTNG